MEGLQIVAFINIVMILMVITFIVIILVLMDIVINRECIHVISGLTTMTAVTMKMAQLVGRQP